MANKAISAQGTKFEISDDGGTTWTEIGNIKTYSLPGGQRQQIDTTNLQSQAKEFVLGVRNNGSLQLDLNRDLSDAGQIMLDAAADSPDAYDFQVTLPDPATQGGTGTVLAFSAYIEQLGLGGGVDQAQTGQCNIILSGAITKTAAT